MLVVARRKRGATSKAPGSWHGWAEFAAARRQCGTAGRPPRYVTAGGARSRVTRHASPSPGRAISHVPSRFSLSTAISFLVFSVCCHRTHLHSTWNGRAASVPYRTMNRLFGRQQAANKPTLQGAITSTEQRADGVEVKLRKLDGELARYRDQMKKMRDGPGKQSVQRRAMGVLRQKRMYEAQLAQLQQQAFNMEQATMTTENLRNTMTTVDAMKSANKEMKRAYGKVDVGQIERLQDEMEDLIDSANEVQETVGRTYGVPDEIDEEDLVAELDAL